MSFEVQQSDRNAAHDIYDGLEMFGLAEAAAQGLLDNGAMVKAIVNVRHQAEEAMRERISMLEKLLSDCADELAAEVEARFERVWGHPGMRRKIERDMNTVVAARAAIRSIDTRGE